MVRDSNYQDLLKLIAICSMVVDHLGCYFFPEITELRVIGRYAMPIFGFFAGYNFKHSVNFSILLSGILLYLISTLFIWEGFEQVNILISIFLGQLYLFSFQNHFKSLAKGWGHFVILLSFFPFTIYFFDYGSLIIMIIIIGYMVRIKSIKNNIAAYVIVLISLLHTIVVFSSFTIVDFFVLFVVMIAIWFSISFFDFEKVVSFNVKTITCHSMLMYFAHILIIQFFWKYYGYFF